MCIIIIEMIEQIEIKRKVFDVVEEIGEHSKKVTRKGKFYFYKDFQNNYEKFEAFIDGANKCRTSGIVAPKIYLYDKNKNIVIMDYIEQKNVLDMLREEDLPDEIFDKAFLMNSRAKRAKVSIDFDPINFGYDGKELYYLTCLVNKHHDKWNLEGESIFLWFYTKDLVNYLINKGLDIDKSRANVNQGYLNKKISLTVVQYYR